MMINKLVMTAAVVATLSLVGCNEDQAEEATFEPATSEIKETAQAAAVEAQFIPVEGVVFEASPNQFRSCDVANGRAQTTVKWDVTQAGIKYVNVLVVNGDDEPKLFMTAKDAGERETGQWIVDGTVLILQDASNKQMLAEVRFAWTQC